MHYYIPFIALFFWWAALVYVTSNLPKIVRSTKMHDVIDAQMIQTIRAIIVAFIIIMVVGTLALFAEALIPY